MEIDKSLHESAFLKIFKDLKNGQYVKPRGELILELENYSYVLDPYVRFPNFKNRKLNINYIKKEFLWYLKGDRFDSSICKYAKTWNSIINYDGSINSNYGQYIFGQTNQFDNVLNILKSDKDSRRASITILNSDHLLSDTKDIPCTYSLNFRIRNEKLNMTVHMRSQDAIYGMGNDAPTFSIIHEMVFNSLKKVYPNIQYGSYYHFADSFHVYEKHFSMLENICLNDEYQNVYCPKISGYEEVDFLRKLDFINIPDNFHFTKWLLNCE